MPIWIRLILLVLILFTLASYIDKKAWWIRVFDFPRLQIAFLIVIFIIVAFFYSPAFNWIDFSLLVIAILALSFQSVYIFPYLPLAQKEVLHTTEDDPGDSLTLIVSNVRMQNKEYGKLIELVKNYKPDILITVETSHWWKDRLAALEEVFPFHFYHPLENTYGMLLFSRIPLIKPEVKFLVQDEVPSIHTKVRFNDSSINLICVHPKPPAPGEADTSVPRDRELMKLAREIRSDREAYIIAGDFNDVAWSDTTTRFQRKSEMLDPRKGRGFFSTYNANIPFLRFPLDHFFFTRQFRLIDMQKLPDIGSDHFPIMVKVELNDA